MTGAGADWIAVDWGTSRLRVWALGQDGSVLDSASSEEGMARLTRDGFEPALLRLVEPWLGTGPVTVLACGMVGSRQGWAEVPYQAVPFKPADLTPRAVPTKDARLRLFIMPGLSQSSPPDVMRGEETQIAGFLAQDPSFDGVICLPGTHSKWVHVSASEIVSFQTFMTGEMFQLLAEHSVLRHGVTTGGNGADDATADEAFDAAVSDAMSRPERVAQRLFSIRAEAVLAGLTPQAARARLSGLLIGSEFAGARPYWLGQQVVLAGSPSVTAPYARALGAQGVTARVLDAGPLGVAGLTEAYRVMRETTA